MHEECLDWEGEQLKYQISEPVLAYTVDGEMVTVRVSQMDGEVSWFNSDGGEYTVTHWRKLPEEPEENADGGANRQQRRAAKHKGKRPGETYADVLTKKKMIKDAVEQSVHDRSIAIEADIKTQRFLWMAVIAAERGFRFRR